MLVPGLEYTFETLVECVSDLGIADQIRVFVLRDSFPPNVIRYAYEQRFPRKIFPVENSEVFLP